MTMEEDAARARYAAEIEAQREEARKKDAEQMRAWAAFCKQGVKVGSHFINSRGDVYKLIGVVTKPDPKVYGSGHYRVEYVGEDDNRNPCGNPMPLGKFETIGAPK